MSIKYKEYLGSSHWRETKRYLKVIKKKKCFICGTRRLLNVHHLHYRTLGYEDGDELMWLCRSHHKEVHFLDGKFIVPDTPANIRILNRRIKRMKLYWRNRDKIKKALDESRELDDCFMNTIM